MIYDVLIVGAGPAGIACARECKIRKPESKILVIEQGLPIRQRICPAQLTGKGCINCNVCAVMCGLGGSGANSDGKFTMPQNPGPYHIGGTLPDYISLEETNRLVLEQHENNCTKGAPNNIVSKRDNDYVNTLDKELQRTGLFRADADVNHIGTTGVRNLYQAYEDELHELGIEVMFRTVVKDLWVHENTFKLLGVITKNGKKIRARKVVLATGRSGAQWLEGMSKKYDIEVEPEKVDFGLRVEVPTHVMEEVNKNLYEAKIIGKYGDVQVRMFCTNPNGAVVIETTDGIKYVNGHSDNNALSKNTNFAVLATYSVKMERPSEMVRNIGRAINDAGGGQPIVQRWGDLKQKRATTREAILRNSVVPTLKGATPGDLTEVFPEKAISAIKKYMADLGKVIKGIDSDDILVYGLEAKFCHSGIALNNQLRCSIGAYVLGDAGCTHGLASAAASGIYAARQIYPD